VEQQIYARITELMGSEPHWGRAPEDAPLPYLVVQPPACEGVEYQSGTDAVGTWRLRLEAYTTSLAQARDWLRRLEEGLTRAALDLGDGTAVDITARASDVTVDPDPAPDGSTVWHGVLDLELTVC